MVRISIIALLANAIIEIRELSETTFLVKESFREYASKVLSDLEKTGIVLIDSEDYSQKWGFFSIEEGKFLIDMNYPLRRIRENYRRGLSMEVYDAITDKNNLKLIGV